MKGIKYDDLLAIVDFIYYGETNIYQENLDSFLGIAEDLCLKGLVVNTNEFQEESMPITVPPLKSARLKNFKKSKPPSSSKDLTDYDNKEPISDTYNKFQEPTIDLNSQHQELVVDGTSNISEDYNKIYKVDTIKNNEDLNETLNTMISKHGESWSCNSCGKLSNDKRNLKKHVENMHTEGLEFPCPICGTIFRSRQNIYKLTVINHK